MFFKIRGRVVKGSRWRRGWGVAHGGFIWRKILKSHMAARPEDGLGKSEEAQSCSVFVSASLARRARVRILLSAFLTGDMKPRGEEQGSGTLLRYLRLEWKSIQVVNV